MYTKKTFITSSLIAISFILFFCEKQKEDMSDRVFKDILMANIISIKDASYKTEIGDFSLDVDDSITISHAKLSLYFYGKDSLKGGYRNVDSTNYLKYLHKVKDNLVFKVYDNKGNFIDKGLISRPDFIRVFFEDMEYQKSEFHDLFFKDINEEYEKIESKYSISRRYIDSLVYLRLLPYDKIKSPQRGDTPS